MSNRPPEGTPEFKEWLKEQAKKDVDAIFGDNNKPTEFDERGAIFGDIENLDKTDAELFPDELEEFTPEERRKKVKLYSGDEKTGGGK
jgi:hypothetical protein